METEKDKQIGAVILDVIRTANLLERLGGKYAGKAGLSSVQQYMLLAMLKNHGPLSMTELRKNTLVTKQAITGLIERMKNQNYIETSKDEQDKRKTIVSITAYGKECLDLIAPHRLEGNRKAFKNISDRELDQLQTILNKLITHLN